MSEDPPVPYTVSYILDGPFPPPGLPQTIYCVSMQSVTVEPTSKGAATLWVNDQNQLVATGNVVMTIYMSDSAGRVLYPTGLAIRSDGQQKLPPESIFPPAELVDGQRQVIQQTDFVYNGGSGPVTYTFSIFFQDDLGNLGLLDPIIINDSGGAVDPTRRR